MLKSTARIVKFYCMVLGAAGGAILRFFMALGMSKTKQNGLSSGAFKAEVFAGPKELCERKIFKTAGFVGRGIYKAAGAMFQGLYKT